MSTPQLTLPHLYPGAARWTVEPCNLADGWVIGLFWTEDDAYRFGERAWPGEVLAVRELVFPDPEHCALPSHSRSRPVLFAGPTTDAKLADAPPNPEDWS